MKVTRSQLAQLTPTEAAALWQVQRDQGAPVEAGLFDEWLEQGPANREAWAKVDKTWLLFEATEDPIFAELRASALAYEPEQPGRSRSGAKWLGAAVAAVAIAVTGTLAFFQYRHHDQSVSGPDALVAWHVYDAPMGSSSNVTLPDGTNMAMRENTTVRIALGPHGRQAVVDHGEVTFSVMHDVARPFTVKALDRRITDVGTRFEVGLADDTLHVKLFEGSVRIDGADPALYLKPGQQFVARPGRPGRVEANPRGSHTDQELVTLNDMTLAEAADVINDGSSIHLVITDPHVAQLRLSGRFKRGEADRFARTAAVLLSLKVVRIAPDRIELRAR